MASPPRNNNSRAGSAFALSVFGRSVRESNCDCDRSSEPSLLQTVFLQNDTQVLGQLEGTERDPVSRTELGGWVNEVTGRAVKETPATKMTRKRLADTRSRLKTLQRRVAELKKQDRPNQKQLTALQAQLRRMRQAEKTMIERVGEPSEEVAKTVDMSQLVEEAYLRTLSRLPTDDERSRSLAFIKESETPAEGLEGVMWALINTKEFIINH